MKNEPTENKHRQEAADVRDKSPIIAEIVKLLPDAPWEELVFIYGFLTAKA